MSHRGGERLGTPRAKSDSPASGSEHPQQFQTNKRPWTLLHGLELGRGTLLQDTMSFHGPKRTLNIYVEAGPPGYTSGFSAAAACGG